MGGWRENSFEGKEENCEINCRGLTAAMSLGVAHL